MEYLLARATSDLTIRSEVELTLSTLLHDVEIAHHLEQRLHENCVVEQYEEKIAALQLRYEEREAAWELERRKLEYLGVRMMEDLVKLSVKGVATENVCREPQPGLENSRKGADSNEMDANQQAEVTVKEKKLKSRRNDGDEDLQKGTNLQDKKCGDEKSNKDSVSQESNLRHSRNGLDNTKSVSSVDNEKEENCMSLPHSLDEYSLMNIFGFLDPLEIMNFAQTNSAVYSKIDTLFGLGGSPGKDSGNDGVAVTENNGIDTEQQLSDPATVPQISTKPAREVSALQPAPTVSQVLEPASPSVESNSQVTVTQELSLESSTPASVVKTSPKLFALPSPSVPAQSSSSITNAANPFSQMFSRFQVGGALPPSIPTSTTTTVVTKLPPSSNSNSAILPASSANAPTSTTGASLTSSVATYAEAPEIKLNAAMANSMASKLTPAELSIILRMREKLQKCEAEAERWRLEKEDVVANLTSVEAVKEFLVERVRDKEKTVQLQQEEMKEIRRKHVSDQEVVAYLDDELKLLKKNLEEMRLKEVKARREASETADRSDKKIQMLSDMLRFEREQMETNEKEWKAAKKVLAREVKSCRARIMALEAENEGFRQQNAQLKGGLMSFNQLPGYMSPGKKAYKSR